MRKRRVSVFLAVVMLFSLFLPSTSFGAEAPTSYKVSGYISPDFDSEYASKSIKEGFKVEIVEAELSAITDDDGYFEFTDVSKSESYTLRITKESFLKREATFDLNKDRQFGSINSPLEMMVGDLVVDGAVNILDIMDLIQSFQTIPGDPKYKAGRDVNSDNSVNFADVNLLVMHFNKSSSDYLPFTIYNYNDPSMPVEERVNNLYAQMTVDEKIGQMIQTSKDQAKPEEIKKYYVGSVISGGGEVPVDNTPEGWQKMVRSYQNAAMSTRMGIPILYGTDAVHGHNNAAGAVIFPHNIGLGAANNPELMSEIGKVTAEEMLSTGVLWNFSPCISVARDERWGRTYESFGENAEIVNRLSAPMFKEFQENYGIVTTAKHYIADGGTTGGVDQGDAKISEEELREVHLPVYKKAIENGVKSVMVSFSSWNGVKNHENKYLITDLLKGELEFKGIVFSDWEAVHQVSGDTLYDKVVKTVNAGVDMLMEPYCWQDCIEILRSAVALRDISPERLEDAVKRILKVKFEMGLFENPLGDISKVTSDFGSEEHKEIARKAVRESLVLLKNENNILPLRKDAKVFLTGPAANDVGVQCGGWTKTWQGGMDDKVSGKKLIPGTTIQEGFEEILGINFGEVITNPARAKDADVAVVVIGEKPYAEMKGDDDNKLALSGGNIVLPGNLEAVKQAKDLGLPIVTVMISGRPRIINDVLNDSSAFVQAWLPGSEGAAIADVLFGDYNFKGKLPCTWPKSYDQLPINADDLGDKEPLFPYGYGLEMDLSMPSDTTPTATPVPTPKPTQITELRTLTEDTRTIGDWTLYNVSNASVTEENYSQESVTDAVYGAGIVIENTGASEDDIQLIHTNPYDLESGEYELTLGVESSAARKARVAVEKDDQTMEAIADRVVDLAVGQNTVTVPVKLKNNAAVKLSLRLGYFEEDGQMAAHTVSINTHADFKRIGDYVDPVVPVQEDPDRYKNKVANGDFSKGKDGWWGLDVVDGEGVVSVPGGKANPWDVMCGYYIPMAVKAGRTFKLSIDIASDKEQIVKFQVVNADNNDAELVLKNINVPGDKTMHTYTFEDFEVSEDCNIKLALQMGGYGAEDENYEIRIDNAQVCEIPKVIDVAVNGDFSQGKGWCWANKSTLDVVDGVAEVTLNGGTANPWDVMFGNPAPFQLEKGRTYTFSFDIKSEVEQDVSFQIVDANDNQLIMKTVHVPADGKMHTFSFNELEVSENCLGKWAFQIGAAGKADQTYKISVDNIKITYPDLVITAPSDDPYANLVKNGDFSAEPGTKYWGIFTAEGGVGTLSSKNGEGIVSITNTGSVQYAIQFFQDGIKLYKGNKYKLSFRYKANVERSGQLRIQQNGGTYTGYLEDSALNFTEEWQDYEKEFTMEYDTDKSARLCFNLGALEATKVDQNIYFDDFKLVMTEGIIPGEEKPNPIRLNQVGYRFDDRKEAFIIAEERTFKLYTADDKLVMTGNLPVYTVDVNGEPCVDANSGDIVRIANFTAIAFDGSFYVKVRADKSPTFAINENVYDDLTAAVLKLFYYQRCGGDGLDYLYVGEKFAHDPCHTGKAKYYDRTNPVYGQVEIDVSGGWHDAGDYGRYITPAAKAVADLLLTAEYFPTMKNMDSGAPERLMKEARYELEWMLKMQHPVTGGVYHKVTTRNHASMTVLPEDDKDQLYLSPVSKPATADFAAVMAYAYTMYKNTDSIFARKCLKAAELAWMWIEQHPSDNAYVDPSFFGTGDYNDSNSKDECYWAAAELYRATNNSKYLNYLTSNPLPSAGFGWADMGSYALVSYLNNEAVDKNSNMYKKIRNRFIVDANNIVSTWKNDGYKVALDYYTWGSNKDLADRAMILIIANKLMPNANYGEAVMDQLNYFLGRNANDISYVTGFGEKAAKHPHHRQSVILQQAVPGMLVGGPNGSIMDVTGDPVSLMVNENTPPAKCYADVDGSYATNEICIYWNSPLVFMMGYIYEQ